MLTTDIHCQVRLEELVRRYSDAVAEKDASLVRQLRAEFSENNEFITLADGIDRLHAAIVTESSDSRKTAHHPERAKWAWILRPPRAPS